MSVLYFLEHLRNTLLDSVFSAITLFGDEVLFMAVAMILFWCVDKFQGYFLFCVGFFGTVLNQFLKMVFRIPRPFWLHKEFAPVASAVPDATGYSFPSGHTQVSVGLYGGIACWNKQTWLRVIAIAMCVLVPFSRLYLGVHTPLDVGVSLGIALVLVWVGYPLFKKIRQHPQWMFWVLLVLFVCVVGQILFLECHTFGPSANPAQDGAQLLDAKENAYTLLGCMFGMAVTYFVDYQWTRFEVKGVWWVQLIKIVIGLGLVVGVLNLTKAPLNALLPMMPARVVRYFLTVAVGGAVWPMTFVFWNRLAANKQTAQ